MDDVGTKGLCPIEDESPLLSEENDIVLDLYNQARHTANCVSGKDKDYYFIQPADVKSLMDINDVDKDDRPEIMRRIQIIENISNNQRPNRPKGKGL